MQADFRIRYLDELSGGVGLWRRYSRKYGGREIRLGAGGWLSESDSVTDGGRSGKGCSEGLVGGCREALKRVAC